MIELKIIYKFKIYHMNSQNKLGYKVTYHTHTKKVK
jgi:hypothetical protein